MRYAIVLIAFAIMVVLVFAQIHPTSVPDWLGEKPMINSFIRASEGGPPPSLGYETQSADSHVHLYLGERKEREFLGYRLIDNLDTRVKEMEKDVPAMKAMLEEFLERPSFLDELRMKVKKSQGP
ncbi:MAG TPA: hypothetical protein VD967_00155 [Candidatus Paceibacterota bacterium]|nr:hypothetical protein [Candidatus Paceibacterota bacterium]